MIDPIPALTIWPEWGPTFLRLDKHVENRGWPPPGWLIGRQLVLHAGANIGGGSVARGFRWLGETAHAAGWWVEGTPGSARAGRSPLLTYARLDGTNGGETEIVTGAVIARVRLLGASQEDDFGCRWSIPGEWHWHLGEFEVPEVPVPARGSQRLWRWTPPEEVRWAPLHR